MIRKIGYYVHHHGMGHLTRALAIAGALPEEITLLGTGLAGKCGKFACIELPDDRDPAAQKSDNFQPDCSTALHYAPLHHNGIRQRTAMIAGWIAMHRPDLLVVDVSVEVAMTARLAATPVLYVRLAGDRSDPAHFETFRNAHALLAPFHSLLDNPQTPFWVRDKTRYCPGLTTPAQNTEPRRDSILMVIGDGGAAITGVDIASAAATTPSLHWRVMGPAPMVDKPPANLEYLGWVAEPAREIGTAEIVIGTAGDGIVNSVIAAGRPFICLPQARPYDEQLSKGRRLSAIGAAVTIEHWPSGSTWPKVLVRARNLKGQAIRSLHDPDGLRRTAEYISHLAASA